MDKFINKIIQGDCLEVMKEIPDKSIDIVLTSPPYNISLSKGQAYAKKYRGYNDCMPNDMYINWLLEILNIIEKKLKENGVVLWNMNYGTNNNETMWIFLSKIITNTNLTIADNIIWKKKSAFPNNCSPNKMTRITENIFVLCRKSEYRTFFMNKKIVSIRKTGQKMYENLFGFIEANNTDNLKTKHNATFSTNLCEKLLKLYSKEKDIVMDCFSGIGTTGVACKNLNRNFILIEKEPEYIEIINKRLSV
jgi:DNA modification methylase